MPRADFAKMKRGAEKWFADLPGLVARQKELEKTLNHDVIGFTTAVAEKIKDTASRWFHFGLTSSDIIDTAFAVQMVQSRGHPHCRMCKTLREIHRQTGAQIQVHALHRPQPRHPRRTDDLWPQTGADA